MPPKPKTPLESQLANYFANNSVQHSPSNPVESTILADSIPAMFRGPHTIELPRPDGGVTDIDPQLVDKDVLDHIPQTQGPEPESYLPSPQRAPASAPSPTPSLLDSYFRKK